MSAEVVAVLTRYDRRVLLVKDIVKAHSKLDDTAAAEIAVSVLRALDTVPETIR
jgi:hypothetical protein